MATFLYKGKGKSEERVLVEADRVQVLLKSGYSVLSETDKVAAETDKKAVKKD